MAIFTPYAAGGGIAFNRTFFNVTLGDVLEREEGREGQRLTLFLVDGATLDVSDIEEVAEQYVMLRAYDGENADAEKSLHMIPYGAIHRIQLSARTGGEGRRVGFHWAPRRAVPKTDGSKLARSARDTSPAGVHLG